MLQRSMRMYENLPLKCFYQLSEALHVFVPWTQQEPIVSCKQFAR